MKKLITTADDFGLTQSVNDAVIEAATHGILTSASLMVAGETAQDAIAKAKLCPELAVGLHLVVIEGAPVLPPHKIPDLVDSTGRFPSDQLALGLKYFFSPQTKRQLAAEIHAQFEAFRATGLTLDHANAHKHMHLHPTVGRMMIDIGKEFGLRAVRMPSEPAISGGPHHSLGDKALRQWCRLLRFQIQRANLTANDHILGLGWTGHMTHERTQTLLDRLPEGLTEMYFHPASAPDPLLQRLMPDYEHTAEFEALLHCKIPAAAKLTTYGELTARINAPRPTPS